MKARGGTSGSGGLAALTFLAAQPFCPSQSEAAAAEEPPRSCQDAVRARRRGRSPRPPSAGRAGELRAPAGGGGPCARQRVMVGRWLGSSCCKEGEGLWQAPPSCTAGCSGRARLGRRAAERPLCSPSVRDGAEWCRGNSDLGAVQGWGLWRIPFLG